jgi:hypothetical protein
MLAEQSDEVALLGGRYFAVADDAVTIDTKEAEDPLPVRIEQGWHLVGVFERLGDASELGGELARASRLWRLLALSASKVSVRTRVKVPHGVEHGNVRERGVSID